ncbi:sulfiredoxin, chloroplastic/mitochondrial isoform X2 [Mangifera indica]|uniref:sulfiredoxin, chloroplastic/mitochondrial isoform X2 n=1 Tax=Mangifera indica TaxID=29780 RepID=UPI001CFA0EC7|nr:sulfiredoxin, chloroplastic/mitochondrial isoform X2 [Mangifera indica]
MANFVLQLPNNLRSFTVFASSNGRAPSSSSNGDGGENGGPVVVELPLDKIKRPLMRTRANDPNKVKELMDSIKEIGLQVPVSLDVTGLKLISALASPLSAAKFAVEPKKL